MNPHAWLSSAAGLFALLAITTTGIGRAASTEGFVPLNIEKGVALKGYDPVAYFRVAAPVQGRPEFTHEWKGASWRFSNRTNLEAFRAAPERYAPQFGGYCAYAVANGYVAPIDPEAWHIENGKLYLNYDAGVKEKWLAQRPQFISKAEHHWLKMSAR